MKIKKILKNTLVLALSTGLMVGCSSATSSDSSSEKGSSTGESTDDGNKVVEFSYMGSIWGDHPQDGNIIFDEMMKRTNTNIDFKFFPSANYMEKVGVTLASKDIPDMIYGANVSTLIDQGAIIPLDDLLNEYGQNILNAIGEENLAYVKQASDGKIYYIPTVLKYKPAYSMQIRQDWLENVGIDEQPSTWEEWKTVWRAFKKEDANGDGDSTNEIPYAGDIYSLMPAFGIQVGDKNAFTVDENNNYTLAYELPQFRQFLEEMRALYKEGLLDPEFATRGTFTNVKELEKVCQSNLAGSTMTWANNTRAVTEVLREVDEDAKLVGVEPIVGPNGDSGIPQRKELSGSATITIAGEDKAEDIIKFFNYIFSEEGELLMSYGIEGETYDLKDGKPILREPYINGFADARKAGLNFTPFPHIFSGQAYEDITLGGKTPEELGVAERLFFDALTVGEESFFKPVPVLSTTAFIEKGPLVLPKIEQLLAECVIGKIDIDTFYSEYEKLKPIGLSDILEQGNEAWGKING